MLEGIAKKIPAQRGRDDDVMKNVTGSLATFAARDDNANQFTSLCSGW